jgi:hypothetical protein
MLRLGVGMTASVDRWADVYRDVHAMFAPVIEPTLSTGIEALAAAAGIWLQQ